VEKRPHHQGRRRCLDDGLSTDDLHWHRENSFPGITFTAAFFPSIRAPSSDRTETGAICPRECDCPDRVKKLPPTTLEKTRE
jgi:hypothetical protein